MLVDATALELPGLRTVRTLTVLGDSIGVGVGDPAAGGGWRGFAPLLAQATGATELVNLAFNGARVGCVRRRQLPAALRSRPDAVILVVGINDSMRSDFDGDQIRADLDHVVGRLIAIGAMVVTVRYHDHARVFRLPGPLRRLLRSRIGQLNAAVDEVAARYRIGVVDLDRMPGAYERPTWAVDRLHPSELGHRMLARQFADRLVDAGAAMPGEVSLVCAGGREITGFHHVLWLVFKGIPWLWRRGQDLVPYALMTMLRAVFTDRPESGAETTADSGFEAGLEPTPEQT
ncbi:MAG TPA: SGNH/GDSL hydrolase family protein [Pseudonocardiaceae bacterium]|nr:SGNH/GDSL hydrolase family protein [Pseudonocardiaceae bacterium]